MGSFGIQNNVALPTKELKLKAYKSFCDHISLGNVRESWYYDDGEYLCCYKTMLSYIKDDPSIFPSITMDIAVSKGYQKWEKVVSASGTGENKKANTASLQMIMRNKFGWDKSKDEVVLSDDAKAFLNKFKSQSTVAE